MDPWYLGWALRGRAAALAALGRAVALLEPLTREFPGPASYRREYAHALAARAALRAGDRAAEAEYRTARELAEGLVAGSEGKPAADDLVNLADALAGLGRRAGPTGGDLLRQAVARYEEALAVCPGHAECRRKLAAARR